MPEGPPAVVFVDTSAWVAAANVSDSRHGSVQELLTQLRQHGTRLVTTNFVLAETYTLIRRYLDHTKAVAFHDDVVEAAVDPRVLDVQWASRWDESAAWEIFKKCDDKSFSYVDCVSFAVMKRLGLRDALACDRHFVEYLSLIHI